MPGTGKTVLVVDDIPANRYIVCRVLKEANYMTIEASSSASALEQAQRQSSRCNYSRHESSCQTGLATLESLHNERDTASIPVVFLSATAQSAFDRSQAEALGASAYLFSPVQPDTLLAVVKGVIDRRERC